MSKRHHFSEEQASRIFKAGKTVFDEKTAQAERVIKAERFYEIMGVNGQGAPEKTYACWLETRTLGKDTYILFSKRLLEMDMGVQFDPVSGLATMRQPQGHEDRLKQNSSPEQSPGR